MRRQFGETRSVVQQKYALVCPDSHEATPMSTWAGCEVVCVITPDMGADFTQFFVTMPEDTVGGAPVAGAERFLFVLEGQIELRTGDLVHSLRPEGYALIPPDRDHEVKATMPSRLVVLERIFVPLAGVAAPELVVGRVEDQPKRAVTDDGLLEVQQLIPVEVGFDCEVNVMEFRPGGSLTNVETHFVEHGLLMLNGGGIYRLDDDWYPVAAGDTIWMGPFCKQWFGAIGASNARYLIYKNWNRDPLGSPTS